jgi:antitoxin (DNA-binding transcriptional repressor) of toxin-antitoxin stability system
MNEVSMKQVQTNADDKAAALLRVASYLGRPQRFMAVADARAEMRRTLEMVAKGSVVLTTHGEPEAAVVPFTTLEDMRRALLHLLVEEMGSSLAHSQKRVQAQRGNSKATSEEELEALAGEVLRRTRRRNRRSSRRVSRG